MTIDEVHNNKENEMRLSETLNQIGDKTNQKHHKAMLRMLDVSRTLDFDLDDFMFEIWKDTLDD